MTVLLGAVDAGLGGCVLGTFVGEAELARTLGVPAGWRLFCAVRHGPAGRERPALSLARPPDAAAGGADPPGRLVTTREDGPALAQADPVPTACHAKGRQGIVLTLWDNLYPLVVFGVVNVAILASKGLLSPSKRKDFSYLHGDPEVYLWVSQSGYYLCVARRSRPYPPGSWCGNTGWQPLYPWMIKVLSGIGISPKAAAIAITEVFALGVSRSCGGPRRGRGTGRRSCCLRPSSRGSSTSSASTPFRSSSSWRCRCSCCSTSASSPGP